MSLITILEALLTAVPRPGTPKGKNPRHQEPKFLESQVRFCWWAGEELGLLGSRHYVDSIVKSGQDEDIAINLNFDMIASPNFQRGIYNGTDPTSQSERAVKASTYIMRKFESHFDSSQLPHTPTPFTGR